MLDLLAALVLASTSSMTGSMSPAVSGSQLPAAPWWERITVTMSGDGQSRGCLYTSSRGAQSSDCTLEAAADTSASGEHSASASDQVTRITFERRFTPGAITPAAAEVQAGDTLLGREVMALAIDGRGSVRSCKVVAASGEMMVDYGCAEARAERFQASASRTEPAQRQGYMTVLIYAHPEHVA